ncbi:unnamed protein product [Trichobilharzia szidati]|nr:unnamed protein product [Trichobilharzia szidati]
MVNQRISEPSSPNSTNGDGDDNNNILNGVNNGVVINWSSYATDANGIEDDDDDDDDLTNQIAPPIGYVLLGSEVLHAADDGGGGDDSEADDALSVSENESASAENPAINQNDSCVQSLDSGADSVNLDIDVDQLLNRQLARTEFEPRGAFSTKQIRLKPACQIFNYHFHDILHGLHKFQKSYGKLNCLKNLAVNTNPKYNLCSPFP